MEADESNDANVAHLAHLVDWLRVGTLSAELDVQERLRLLIDFLANEPELRGQVCAFTNQFLSGLKFVYSFAELGILSDETFGQALSNRIFQRMLPATLEDKTLQETLNLVFPRKNDHEWLSQIPVGLWVELLKALGLYEASAPIWTKARLEAIDSMEILSVRIAGLGVDSELVQSLGAPERAGSPFVEQLLELRSIMDNARAQIAQNVALYDSGQHLDVLLDQCKQQIKRAYSQARNLGISVGLSLRLMRLEQSINRLRDLMLLSGLISIGDRVELAVDFFCTLTREENRKHSITDLWRSTTGKVAQRITEYASRTGEKYATETASEYWAMARAAAGAGVVIAVLSLIKAGISSLNLPPLWEAVGFSLNYGLGFVLIHILSYTIATKQPAMTAAHLASSLEGYKGTLSSQDKIETLIVQVVRTQFVAILGNVVLAFLTATAIALFLGYVLAGPVIGEAKAAKMMVELNPIASAAIAHAAIAGVFLYLSGVIAGYYDNLCLYYKIPSRLKKVIWLRSFLGVNRVNQLADYVAYNLGALASNFFFGCMLGSIGFLGLIVGLPLDIRHITFSTANLAYALNAHDYALPVQELVLASVGVVLIGFVNLAVSFGLAFKTALRARGIYTLGGWALMRGLVLRFMRQPREFFLPPSDSNQQMAVAPAETEAEMPVKSDET